MEPEKQVFSSLERITRISGRGLNVVQLEQLRSEVAKLTAALRQMVERVALQKCRKLNDAVGVGFTQVAHDVDAIETRVKALEE